MNPLSLLAVPAATLIGLVPATGHAGTPEPPPTTTDIGQPTSGCQGIVCPTTDPTPAVDDPGPCPAGSFAWLPDGASYDGPTGVWSVDGVIFGFSAEEDQCWKPMTAWADALPPGGVDAPAIAQPPSEGPPAQVLPQTR